MSNYDERLKIDIMMYSEYDDVATPIIVRLAEPRGDYYTTNYSCQRVNGSWSYDFGEG